MEFNPFQCFLGAVTDDLIFTEHVKANWRFSEDLRAATDDLIFTEHVKANWRFAEDLRAAETSSRVSGPTLLACYLPSSAFHFFCS